VSAGGAPRPPARPQPDILRHPKWLSPANWVRAGLKKLSREVPGFGPSGATPAKGHHCALGSRLSSIGAVSDGVDAPGPRPCSMEL